MKQGCGWKTLLEVRMLGRSMKLICVGWMVALSLTFGLCGTLNAQTSLGQIAGTVTDSTGSLLPGATITITNLGTQDIHTITSDNGGVFIVTKLPIGN